MKSAFTLVLVSVTLITCSSDTSSNQPPRVPIYGHKVLEHTSQPIGTETIAYYVVPDTIKRYGAQNVLLLLAESDCKAPCKADLWDDLSAYQMNTDNPYGKRTDKWQKQHYAAIADHLVAFKDFESDEVINYPLTYDSNYKKWGGKLKH